MRYDERKLLSESLSVLRKWSVLKEAISNSAEYLKAQDDIRRYKEALIGVGLAGKKDPGYSQRIKELESQMREFDAMQKKQAIQQRLSADDSAYSNLKYDKAHATKLFAKEAGEGAHGYYNKAMRTLVTALEAGKDVRFFLKDVTGSFGGVLWFELNGDEIQLTKKKIRLKELNGMLNGDFSRNIGE